MAPTSLFSVFSSLIALTLLPQRSLCQDSTNFTTTAYHDPVTGLDMQRFQDTASNLSFAIAVPNCANKTDFIGQLTFPLNGSAGWGGFSVNQNMVGPLLFAAWSDGKNVISSFRQAPSYDYSPPETSGPFKARAIAKGTSVNDTHLCYTFVCECCLDPTFGFQSNATMMGYALSSKPVAGAEAPSGVLKYHDLGFGAFKAQLDQAKVSQADFDGVAGSAEAPLMPAANATAFNVTAAAGGGM
ncbi:uncharacterized protein JN550_013051 [Neoarthrinium moseri]|uniref:uncharacterized protein n=1 Tax=Neoarthrinium moseri TaxID=1658444 RepID=UPI001FDC3B8C|nr:uncharacterized protein JN550_013051 [Neoarthrinium moseri]KAI1857788.1 hypothetical protein JN550_013051 [Neoarthrinium moseri]